jgi:hypothetical protein
LRYKFGDVELAEIAVRGLMERKANPAGGAPLGYFAGAFQEIGSYSYDRWQTTPSGASG